MESIYDSLVTDDAELVSPAKSGGAGGGSAASQQYPPWFHNFPGYSPHELAELTWKGRLPHHVEQLLRSRQAEYAQRTSSNNTSNTSGQAAGPTRILVGSSSSSSSSGNRDNSSGDLFDKHRHFSLQTWRRNFKNMSAEEVDSLISQQRYALKYSTYAEDFHYQQTMARQYPDAPPPKHMPPLMGVHKPIALEPLEHPIRPEGDMFVGVLGKIAFSSIKCPKPILQLPGHQDSVLKATSSKSIRALESGSTDSHAFLSVVEDGLIVVLHLMDMASVVPQLPHSEQAYFVAKQQQIVANLVYVLNVFVARRPIPEGSFFPRLISLSKGRKLISRSLGALPVEQRMALLLVCLSHASLINDLPEDLSTRSLRYTIGQVCSSFPIIAPAISGLMAVSQGFRQAAAFAQFCTSRFGALIVSNLLFCVRRAFENDPQVVVPPQWAVVLNGLYDALASSFLRMLQVDPDHPSLSLLNHMYVLLSQPHRLLMRSLLRAPVVEMRDKLGNHATQPILSLAELLK